MSPGEVDKSHEDLDRTNDDGLDITTDSRDFRIFIALYSYDPITMSPNKANAADELPFMKDQFIKIIGDMDEDGFYFGELNGRSGFVPSNMVAEVDTMSNTILDSSGDAGLSDDKENNSDDEDPIGVNDTRKSDSFDLSHMLKPSKIAHLDNEEDEPISELLNKSLSSSVPVLSTSTSAAGKNNAKESSKNENFLPSSYSLPELQNSSEDEEGGSTGRKRVDPYQLKPRLMVALFDYDPAVSSPNVDSEVITLLFKFIFEI